MHLLVAPRKDAARSSFTRDAGGSKEMGIAMQGLEKSLNTTSHRGEGKGLETWAQTTVKSQRNLLAWQRCSIYSRILGISGLRGGRAFSLPMSCLNASRLHQNRTKEGATFLDVLQKLQFSNVCNPSLSTMTQCLTQAYSQDTRPQNPFSATQLHALKQRKR